MSLCPHELQFRYSVVLTLAPRSGTLLTLPYDLRLGFARLLASLNRSGDSRSCPSTFKRYNVGPIYRQNSKNYALNMGKPTGTIYHLGCLGPFICHLAAHPSVPLRLLA